MAPKSENVLRSVRACNDAVMARSCEVRGARWEETKGSEWNRPAERTKQVEPYSIYLSSRAMEILEEARKLRTGPLIFLSAEQREMSDNTLNK